jgi:hypothetical protein
MSRKVAFFATIKEFLTGLRQVFPEIHGDLYKLQSYITVAESTFPKLVITQFMERIAPLYAHIIDQNEQFFREHLNYEQTLDSTCDELDVNAKIKILMDKILRFIGQEWNRSLNGSHKAEIWNYLQTMLVTGAYAYDANPKTKTYGYVIEYAKTKAKANHAEKTCEKK